MNIFDFSPYYNENTIAKIKIEENSSNGIITCVTESNRTFRYEPKNYNFEFSEKSDYCKYFKIDGNKHFVGKKMRISRHPWFIKFEVNPWKNEEIQRNIASKQVNVKKNDIVILSDIDEILDRKKIPDIIKLVNIHGIITVPLRVNIFYFNLVCTKWVGPPNYSYKIFIMTGEYFNNLKMTSDELRKKGESGQLIEKIYCHNEFCGYHLSWIGDYMNAVKKLNAYSHSKSDHMNEIYNNDGTINKDILNNRIKNGMPIFYNQTLEIQNDLPLLESIKTRKDEFSDLFIR
jgi:hypothetical protein